MLIDHSLNCTSVWSACLFVVCYFFFSTSFAQCAFSYLLSWNTNSKIWEHQHQQQPQWKKKSSATKTIQKPNKFNYEINRQVKDLYTHTQCYWTLKKTLTSEWTKYPPNICLSCPLFFSSFCVFWCCFFLSLGGFFEFLIISSTTKLELLSAMLRIYTLNNRALQLNVKSSFFFISAGIYCDRRWFFWYIHLQQPNRNWCSWNGFLHEMTDTRKTSP